MASDALNELYRKVQENRGTPLPSAPAITVPPEYADLYDAWKQTRTETAPPRSLPEKIRIMKENEGSRTTVIGLGVTMAVIGFGCLLLLKRAIRRADEDQERMTAQTTACITKTTTIRVGRSQRHYRAEIAFEHQGQTRTADISLPMKQEFTTGHELPVRFDPADPEKCVPDLPDDGALQWAAWFLGGVAIAGAGLLLWILS